MRSEPGDRKQLIGSAEGFVTRSLELVFEVPHEVTMTLVAEPKPLRREPAPAKKKPTGLSIDEQNPYK